LLNLIEPLDGLDSWLKFCVKRISTHVRRSGSTG